MSNRLFKRLPPAPRKRILAYIEAPTIGAWRQVRETIVSPGLTLFDVVEKIDRDFSWFAGYLYPSAILVARASRYADALAQEAEKIDSLLTPGDL